MTDENETAVTAEDPGTNIPAWGESVNNLFTIWASYYSGVLNALGGNPKDPMGSNNKADKQQYRLKATDVAYMLTELTVRSQQ